MQILYEDDLNPDRGADVADAFLVRRLHESKDQIDFGRSLLAGIRKHRSEIDQLLVERADNWTLERMAVIDRLILRMAVGELLHAKETPPAVIINEALELDRTFSTEDAVKFINGLLDGIRKKLDDRV